MADAQEAGCGRDWSGMDDLYAWTIPADLADLTREEALFIVDELRREMFFTHPLPRARWHAACWSWHRAERLAQAASAEWLRCLDALHQARPSRRDAASLAEIDARRRHLRLSNLARRLWKRSDRLFEALRPTLGQPE